ncbi:hypothetical protein WICMUC_000795 [Wickerhamomyces mucosus]|uniref:Uncharacterized protein n=1 Tax=Wickerhamomyces mucosus TaxID=1378264 RepID=A0A9P8TIA0_9ASCO|nr:hypothetical protein WICMUC_000795 [Wickerhamomyces mucosus]
MSIWPFGQNSNSSSNLNRLLDYYFQKKSIPKSENTKNSTDPSSLPMTSNISSVSTNTIFSNSGELVPDIDVSDNIKDIDINKEFVYEILDDINILNELNRQNNKLIEFICFGYINDEHNSDGTLINVDNENYNGDFIDDDDHHSQEQELDEEGDVKTIHNDNVRHRSGYSVLELLVDVIVDSIEWFETNEAYLFQSNNDQELKIDHDLSSEDLNQIQSDIADQQNSLTEINQEELSIIFNRIHVASEILSCKIWLISESIVEESTLLNKLWSFLNYKFKDSSPSIQYFIKINEQLLESRPDQMLNFIRSQQDLVDSFIKHIDITIIMDFLLRIITTDKTDIPTGIIDLLSEQGLIPKLLELLLYPGLESSTQSSSGDFLKALISISANTSIDENTIGPNLLTRELVNDQNVDKMIEIILNKGNGLSTIVGVIIEIIRKNNSDYDAVNLLYTSIEANPPNKRDSIYLGYLLRKFSDRLGDFNQILINKELSKKRIENQIGQSIEPLGFERFKVCELIAELLHCSNIGLLNNELTETIIQEREAFLQQQESNLANALSEAIIDSSSEPTKAGLNISKLHIGGTAEPSVAVNSKNITISPNQVPKDGNSGTLPLHDLTNNDEEFNRDKLKSNPTVGDFFKIQLIESNILKTIITMFNKFPWNNFWHNVVFDIVQQIFNGKLDTGYNPYLILELFKDCDITNLIIDSYNLCLNVEKEENVRLGYMGHLVLIAEEVVKFSTTFQNSKFNDNESDQLIYSKLMDQNWVNYVTNILTETREQYNCVLGGIKTQEFQQSDYLNSKAIVLGNSEEEILNQPLEDVKDDSDLADSEKIVNNDDENDINDDDHSLDSASS